MKPKYPNVKVRLTGENGNPFHLIGIVSAAMKRYKVLNKEIEKFKVEALNGDYDNVLQTCLRWVDVE